MLQTNPPFMAKLLEQLGGCAAISGGNSWELHRIRKGALISLWQGHSRCFQGPGGWSKAYPSVFTHLFKWCLVTSFKVLVVKPCLIQQNGTSENKILQIDRLRWTMMTNLCNFVSKWAQTACQLSWKHEEQQNRLISGSGAEWFRSNRHVRSKITFSS